MFSESNGAPKAANRPNTGPNPGKNAGRVTSEALLGAAGELVIIHAGREYRLRLTQNGKLILTA
jgi:hemin uptake protein HemP